MTQVTFTYVETPEQKMKKEKMLRAERAAAQKEAIANFKRKMLMGTVTLVGGFAFATLLAYLGFSALVR